MKNQNPTTKLSDIFSQERYGFTAAIALGNGQSLKIRYRAQSDQTNTKTRVFLRDGISGLGFDPDVFLAVAAGVLPKGEPAEAFEQAMTALGETAGEKITEAWRLADGYALSQLIGEWSLLDGRGAESDIDEEVTAESCAALPPDVSRSIARLASEAAAPAESLAFFAGSPRS